MNELAKSLILRCTEMGVAEWVICPGARNVDLLALLAKARGITLWTHFDERSAGFFALGRIMDTGRPVAVVTTSGTAVAELLPAVVESHYQGRPLVIVSADREPEFRGSGAPQAIIQPGIFGEYVSRDLDLQTLDDWSGFDAPGVWPQNSPIHINICLPEPRLDAIIPEFELVPSEEPPSVPFKENVGTLARFLQDNAWRGILVMLGGLEPSDQDPTLWLLRQLGAPVVADATSGLREELGDLVIQDSDYVLKHQRPGCVLRIGEIPTGRFWRDLEDLPDIQVFSLSRTGYPGLAKRPSTVIKGSVERIVKALGDVFPVGDALDLLIPSRKRTGKVDELLRSLQESEQALVHGFSLFASMGDLIYLGNSMPVREWNLVGQRQVPTVNVRANRGANGIDGQLSTFLGASARCNISWALFGDLTALYDANAPALAAQFHGGKRIAAIINNKGGHIFDRLPGAASMNETMQKLLIQPHDWNIRPLAELWNAHYRAVHTLDDLDFEPEEGLTFLEIIPDEAQTQLFWERYSR